MAINMNRNLAQNSEQSESLGERRRPSIPSSEPHIMHVLVCGDQPLYRAALASLIERDDGFRIAGESTNDLGDVARALNQNDIQMVLIDYDIVPESRHDIEALERLLDCVAPRTTVIISSGLDSDACQRAVRHGTSG